MIKLPSNNRPRGTRPKVFFPGADLPAWFWQNLKSIDKDLFVIWHPYEFLWDMLINEHTGPIDDPRFNIHYEYGEECWGWVLTNPDSSPKEDGSWHVWRHCWPHGWAHIVKVESKLPDYLSLLTRRLYLQATIQEKYGDKEYRKRLEEGTEKEKEKEQDRTQDLFDAVQEENKWLLKSAMENMEYGRVKPTNPTHDSIISYPGQKNRSRIVRPLEDREGGLVIPDKF